MADFNKSSISILVGEEIGDNQQSEFKLELVGGKGYTTFKMEQYQDIAAEKNFDLQNSLVVSLPCAVENQDILIDLLTNILEATCPDEQINGLLAPLKQAEQYSYSLGKSNEKVVLMLKLKDFPNAQMQQQFAMASAMTGLSNPNDKPFAFTFDLKSLNTFYDIEKKAEGGLDFLTALLTSFHMEIDVELKGSLISTVLGGAAMFMPQIANSPAMLLKEFQNFNLDLKFRDILELPQSWRERFLNSNEFKDGLPLPLAPDSQDEYDHVKQIVDLIDTGLEMNLFFQGVSCFNLDVKLPGFGSHVMN